METKVNYETLHIRELKEELNKINEESDPEKAEYIRDLINKGGYKYPEKAKIESAEITNIYFKWALVAILSSFLMLNIFTLIFYLYPITLVSIVIQSTILFMIMRNHKNLRLFIRIWSTLLIFSGITGLLAINLNPDDLNIYNLTDKLINLIAGSIFFWLSGKFIVLHEKTSKNV